MFGEAALFSRLTPGIGIAFIESGQYDRRWPDSHLTPAQTAQAAATVRARRVMPVHWGAYSMAYHPWDEPVRQSVPAIRALGVNPLTPVLGQVFDAQTVTSEWYLGKEY
ncbi:MAG: MBL fold metallo-hydrolase [Pseudomonadota bacterium]|nr:MBL fold metallo-hydrolase [Pseudomonadota bacterium]